jgi:hypothetical protein
VHSTMSQNGVLVDGQGQIKHTSAPHGNIVADRLGPDWDYVAGDATAAYGGRLKRCLRHVVLVKDGQVRPFLVLYDDLEAAAPATFQFMLHSYSEFAVDEKAQSLKVSAAKAGAEVRYLAPALLKFRQWDGYQPPPAYGKTFPNQWHAEAGTVEKRAAVGMLTVIVPHRAGQAAAWTAVRMESESLVGVRLTGLGQPVLVTFRKPDGTGIRSGQEAVFVKVGL